MELCKILLFLCILLSCSSSEAQDNNSNPVYLYHTCSIGGNTSAGSAFQSNLGTLLSSNTKSIFYNTTVPGENPLDTVFGLFMCRGDVPLHLCQACVHHATQRLSTQCPLAKQSVIWYDECMVRYSNHSFFSTFDTRPAVSMLNTGNVSNQESFMRLLFRTINTAADEAARGKKFATKEANISEFQSLYCLAQCTSDLSPQDCRTCLSGVIGDLPLCCQGKRGGRVLYPSCNVRYELYPFYRSATYSQFSEDPIYVYHNCSATVTVAANSSFNINLKTLLSYMSSNATNGVKSYKDSVDTTVYGLFMCRGDLHFSQSQICQQCVLNATQRISSECNSFQEAIIWYTHCMLRYSNRHFFSQVEKNPSFQDLNVIVLTASQGQDFLNFSLSNMVFELAEAAGDTAERYATKSLKLDDSETLYTLAQCTQDLSANHCKGCLQDINTKIQWYSMSGRVLYPSCNLRFELFPFYSDHHETQWPMPDNPSPPTQEKRKGLLRTMILIIVLTIVSVSLLFLGYYLVKRKTKKSIPNILRENFGVESATLEPLQFSLAVIEAATNNFSNENKIGKGGFGEVYKGILLDGRQIAVKRLSKSSKQGENEFKNEVLLIAKLQHRNLVTFIGFCLEEQDRILIYEYVPNKSLDYFLFDSDRPKLLSWFERYNIIKGIVRGVLYLHELSRLKVIHRDLKPSNVLLDKNMIPKISDFGMARIVEINEDEGSTDRIVGTYGYMSPEYAMFGQFSEKSDVFSFGIMLLEIITGKRNLSSYQPHLHLKDNSLLSYVWKQWRNQTPSIILDPNIKENYSEMEVSKCIQIGLLCVQQNPGDRPTMLEVASYLSTYLTELPSPHQPAFFLHSRMDSKTFAQESSSNQSINATTPISVNEMSETQFFPR